MYRRFRTLCIKTGGLLGAGLFYAFLCFSAGRPLIPCLFHETTGLYCPGCGVSHMCMALLRLDFEAAFRANSAIMMLLPVGLVIGLQMAVRYIREGKTQPTRIQTVVLLISTIILLVFTVIRNLPAFIRLTL